MVAGYLMTALAVASAMLRRSGTPGTAKPQ
jgi:hypothetical protein